MILNLCLKIADLTGEELEALQQAIVIEKRRRQGSQDVTEVGPTRSETRVKAWSVPPAIIPAVQRLETPDYADPWLTSSVGAEQWSTTRIVVTRRWPRSRTPWTCGWCGAEWCRVRKPPTAEATRKVALAWPPSSVAAQRDTRKG